MSRRVRWGIGILVVALLVGLARPVYQIFTVARYAARLDVSRHKLKQIGLALHNYHDKYGSFPPAYTLGPDGKPWHSWRVLVLPFLNEQNLYDRYRFDEPWDGPHNKTLQALRPDAYASKLQESNLKSITTYLGVVSRRTMWPAHFCATLNDVTDGPSNTIMLIENSGGDVIWTEPREMSEPHAMALLRPGPVATANAVAKPQTTDRLPILFADGSVRLITPHINRDTFVSMLTPKYGAVMVAGDWPADEAASSRIPDLKEIEEYPGTVVLDTPDATFDPSQSNLYCATTQLAWDHLRPASGQAVAIGANSLAADSLNAHPFPLDALDERAYFASGTKLDDVSSAAMLEAFRQKFPNAPLEVLQTKTKGLTGTRILAYLEKSLPFPDVMTRFEKPLKFGTSTVQSFGWLAATNGTESQVLIGTVEVRDFTHEDDFIVLLKTNSTKRDEIILARVLPDDSLEAIWDAVAERMKKPMASNVVQELREIDELQIPILSFGVIAPLKDLIGLPIPTAQNPGRYIDDAQQTIRFRLDEYGAELIADTQMIIGDFGGEPVDPKAPRRLIFDRPFLIAIKEKNAMVPYFLGWIGNADLMELMKTP